MNVRTRVETLPTGEQRTIKVVSITPEDQARGVRIPQTGRRGAGPVNPRAASGYYSLKAKAADARRRAAG